MCEKKNKKLLVSLFLIPLFSLITLFTGIGGQDTVSAVACPAVVKLDVKYVLDEGGNIVKTESGYKRQGTGTTSYDVGQCEKVDDSTTFKYSGEGLVYFADGNKNGSRVTLNSTPARGQDVNGKYQLYMAGSPSGTAESISVAVDKDADITGVAAAGTDGEGGADGKTSCAIQGIGWLLCPVMNFTAGIADTALGFISDSFLSVNTQLYDTNSGTYSAWQGILGFANIIFVIIFLIIIFAQATGVGISNYGIKKMLPKLIIGVILINISYFICQAAVDISNITGYGFNKFFDNITTNVVTSGAPQADGDTNGLNTSSWQYITGIVITAGAGVGLAYLLGLSVLIPILFVVVVTLLFIFLILILRQALIVVLIIVAPLAFAAWLLPNTEKFFKQWWGLFSKLLLLFPIISIVFGASKLASAILRDAYTNINPVSGAGSENVATNNSELIGQIIAAGILVIPLIAVPLILKGALNAVPVLGNMMQKAYNNNTGKARQMGANSGLAQYDKQRKANRNARVASGNYRGAGGVANPFNLASKFNRGVNRNGAFNAVTYGYGAQRDLAAQRQSEKDRKEAVDMFNNNEGLMEAWSKSRGSKNSAEYQKLDATGKRQFDRMVAVGHARKSTSFLAVADYMSQNGKGDFSTYRNALVAAQDTGADAAEISDTEAGSLASYRSNGRGDIVGQIRAHQAANMVEKRDIDGKVVRDAKGNAVMEGSIFGSNNATREAKLVAMQQAWSETAAAKVHRDGIKIDRDDDGQVILDQTTRMAAQPSKNKGTPSEDLGMIAYQMHLTATNTKTLVNEDGHPILDAAGQRQLVAGDGQNIGSALEKFNDMEQRAQNQVKDTLIGAAEDFRLQQYQQAVRNGVEPQEKFQNRIVNINQAKDMFGMLPGGRFTASNTSTNQAPPTVNNAPRPPESNEERLRQANNINDGATATTPDTEPPDDRATDSDYDSRSE